MSRFKNVLAFGADSEYASYLHFLHFLYVIRSYLAVASPTARVLAAMRAKVAPHMARALGDADAFQIALQELGNNENKKEETTKKVAVQYIDVLYLVLLLEYL
jgi:hypothetical protein